MNILLFEKNEIEKKLPIKDERAKHILEILHKKIGDSVDAGIVDGKAGKAKILSIDEDFITFEFTELSDGKKLYPLSMIIGFPRPIQLRRLFRDMAGLGVEKIYLTGTELGEKSYMQGEIAKDEKAYSLLKEGAIQAKSTHITKLKQFISLKDCVEECSKDENAIFIALDNVKAECSLNDFLKKTDFNLSSGNKKRVFAAIGSERGWTDREREIFKKNNFTICSMGNRVLRTETASTVAASIILGEMGFLN